MKDRVPVNPGRVLITPENGSAAFYATMARADNPTQEGHPLNKNTLLKDTTAALFGLGSDAVPDDVFSLIKTLVTNAQNTANNAQNSADVKAKITTGSYTGTGTTSKTFSFGFTAQILIIKYIPKSTTDSTSYVQQCFLIKDAFCNISWSIQYGGSSGSVATDKNIKFNGNIVTSTQATKWNLSGANYEYIAIG